MAGGYIYVLANPSFADLYKIGCTTKDAFTRAAELYTTGVPYKFDVVFSYYIKENVSETEVIVHEALSNRRVNESREFFRFESEEQCVLAVLEAILAHEHSTVLADDRYCIDDGEVQRYRDASGQWASIVIKFFSPSEIQKAAARYGEAKDLTRTLSPEQQQKLANLQLGYDKWHAIKEESRQQQPVLEAT